MPKLKTKKIVTKRFKVTKTGKVMHRVKGARHLRRNKSSSRKRRQDAPKELTHPKIKRMVKRFIAT